MTVLTRGSVSPSLPALPRAIRMGLGWIGKAGVAGAALLIAPASANADTLEARPADTSGIRSIGRGVKELGGESLLVLGYAREGSASSFRLSTVTGLSFRYFVANNLNLTLNASYFYKGNDTASSQGGVFTLGANYLINILTRGLFINTGVAVGGFVGGESIRGAPEGTKGPSLLGGAARAGFGLTFYAGPRFNLFARPEAILYLGSASQGKTSVSLLNVDGGFNVGASLVF
jgi:hypothetical protein